MPGTDESKRGVAARLQALCRIFTPTAIINFSKLTKLSRPMWACVSGSTSVLVLKGMIEVDCLRLINSCCPHRVNFLNSLPSLDR